MPDKDPQKKRDRERKRRLANPEKAKQQRDNWIKNNPDKWKEGQRRSRFKSRYGITLEDYNHLWAVQSGCCAICQEFPDILVVDHCHTTKKVRALLCNPCNQAIGMFKESILIISSAAEYLRRYK